MFIVSTLDRNANDYNKIKELIDNGLNTIKINLTHFNQNKAEDLIKYIKKNHKQVKVMIQLQGNKITVSDIVKESFKIHKDDIVYFANDDIYAKNIGKQSFFVVPVSLNGPFSAMKNAQSITMTGKSMEFKILEKKDTNIKTIAQGNGYIRAKKSINSRGIDRTKMKLNDTDKQSIIWAMKQGVDIITMPCVTTAKHISDIREFMNENKNVMTKNAPEVWAVIDTKEGTENINEITKEADGIIIDREELYSEVDYFQLPLVQNNIINIAQKFNKSVIAASVFEDMKTKKEPSLSQVEIVQQLIQKNISGFMLSIAVSTGNYHELAVKTIIKSISFFKQR